MRELLDDRGRLREPGWNARPAWRYDPRAVARRARLKEWDFYGVTTPRAFVGLVVARVGPIGLAAVQWIDLEARRVIVERISITPFARAIDLPTTSETGDTRYGFRSTHVHVAHGAGGARTIEARWRDLHVELELGPAQGIAVAAPLAGGRGFYYNHKIPALPARGSIALGTRRAPIEDGFATLDWGRGVWPHRTSWRWAAIQGRLADGRAIGLTLGDVSADPGAAREDAMIVDGALTKLDPVAFDSDLRRIRSAQLDLELTPLVDNSRTIQLVVASSRLRSAIGTFRGTVRTDRETLALAGVPGWAEEHLARW